MKKQQKNVVKIRTLSFLMGLGSDQTHLIFEDAIFYCKIMLDNSNSYLY